jgi:hypothetical protein
VWFFDDDQRFRSLPAAWTDVAPPVPFVAVAAGRCPLRLDDLQRIATLLRTVEAVLAAREGQ